MFYLDIKYIYFLEGAVIVKVFVFNRAQKTNKLFATIEAGCEIATKKTSDATCIYLA